MFKWIKWNRYKKDVVAEAMAGLYRFEQDFGGLLSEMFSDDVTLRQAFEDGCSVEATGAIMGKTILSLAVRNNPPAVRREIYRQFRSRIDEDGWSYKSALGLLTEGNYPRDISELAMRLEWYVAWVLRKHEEGKIQKSTCDLLIRGLVDELLADLPHE